MSTRSRIFPLADDGKLFFLFAFVIHPFFLLRQLFHYLFRQRNGSSTWSIFLLRVMYFLHYNCIFLMRSHKRGEFFIYLKKNIYANAEIARVKKTAIPFLAKPVYFVDPV